MGKARERPTTDYRAMLARAYYGHWTAAGDPRHRRPARYLCGARQLRGAGADTPQGRRRGLCPASPGWSFVSHSLKGTGPSE
jgi:hypothetical protein